MPEGHYGWIQECGEAFVSVSGQKQAAYADFRPNAAKRDLKEELSKIPLEQSKSPLTRDTLERLSQLPPLLIEDGPYCRLMTEARDVFVDGHFYACVAMCGISFERFQRDKAEPYGATQKDKMSRVRSILKMNRALSPETFSLCKSMAELRNKYAHGHGLNPKEDALKALAWMHSFIDNETSLMRHYTIKDGILYRNIKNQPESSVFRPTCSTNFSQRASKRGIRPSFFSSPLLFKERGTKRVPRKICDFSGCFKGGEI